MSERKSTLPESWRDCDLAQPEPVTGSCAVREFLNHLPVIRDDLPSVWEYPDSDDGNAAFYLSHFQEILRFVPESKLWRVFHKGRWHTDTTGRTPAFAQLLSRHQLLRAEAYKRDLAQALAEQVISEGSGEGESASKLTPASVRDKAKAARRRAESLGREKVIAGMLQAASHRGHLIVPSAAWDADPWQVGVQNGVLDLRTLRHRAGRPDDLVTKSLNAEFSPGAGCPEWRRFIARVMPDAELSDYLQTLCGYFLTGSRDDQAFYFFHGDGKNGKSILVGALATLFGEYGAKARSTLIEEPHNGADPKADIAQLPGIRFLHGEETRQGARLREELVKSLTGGDSMMGEAKYAAPFEFVPVAKLVLMGNHKPRIHGTDGGIWRRVRLIPFTQVISEAEAVPPSLLLASFAEESSGILNWLLEGLSRCPAGAIPMPVSVQRAVAEYRSSEDDLGEFLGDCTQDAAEGFKTHKRDLFAAYRTWAEDNGIRQALTAKQLTRQLKERPGWTMDPRRESWVGKSVRHDA